jgi:sodium transport system ATP-binding protein
MFGGAAMDDEPMTPPAGAPDDGAPGAAPPDPAALAGGIVADRLTKVFPDRRRGPITAASEVSFACRPAEVFGLLGTNGAGKSTTLRMLSTVLRPTAGTALVAGRDIVREPLAVRRAIGFLSGNTGLYARLTPRETLRYFGRLHGMPPERLEARIEEVLDLLEIRAHADVRCERLSTGTRQKTSIARAILHDPPVLILDEPTLGLDILVASAMVRFIAERRERGKCIIFSTHILSEAEKLCDRLAVIHGGRVRAVGTLEELRARTGKRFLEDVFLALVGA